MRDLIVGAVYDRPGFFAQSPLKENKGASCKTRNEAA